MAPERFKQGLTSSIASDIFSLGLMYMEMITGTLPYRNDLHPVQSLISGAYLTDAKSLLKSKKVPGPIQNLILSMIAYSHAERPNNYKLLRDSCNRALKRSKGFFYSIFN